MKKTSKSSEARFVTVDPDEADRRLDNFLMGRLKGVPRSRVYRMIRGGEVRVNKGRAKPDRRLVAGDMVRIPPHSQPDPARPAGGLPGRNAAWIEDCIVYEDRDLLILNKPSGLAVHGGSGVSYGAIELLRIAREVTDGMDLVHRLDRDTSGCLLVSKRRPALRRLHELFRLGEVHKRYTALLLGSWKGGNLNVDAPLLVNSRRGGERHVTVADGGKSAFTKFIPEQAYVDAQLTTVELGTGRTHQIRVHAAHIGHPVAGDTRYGPEDDIVVKKFGLDRLFLHASSLAFESPKGDRVIRAECPLDDKLESVLKRLQKPRPGRKG
jgi:23S rRNA pseudouridine955/2504/2580 synthase